MKSKQPDFENHVVGTVWTSGQWLQYITKMVGAYNGKQFKDFQDICEMAWLGHGVNDLGDMSDSFKKSSIETVWANRKIYK